MSEITLSNLAIALFGLATLMFALDIYRRRLDAPRPNFSKLIVALRVIVLVLALAYFYFKYFA